MNISVFMSFCVCFFLTFEDNQSIVKMLREITFLRGHYFTHNHNLFIYSFYYKIKLNNF